MLKKYLYTFPTPQSNFTASAKLTLIKGILRHQKPKSWGGWSTRQRKLRETSYSILGNLRKLLTNGINMKEIGRPRSFRSARFFQTMTLKSNIFYCHTGSVLMNAIATQDCTHDPTFRHNVSTLLSTLHP